MTRSRGWLIAGAAVLALSLGGNLLLAGALLGRHVGDPPRIGFIRVLPGAPPEAKAVLRESFGEHRSEMRAHLRAHHKARKRVAEVLAAPELDAGELDRALAELAEATARLQTSAHAIVREAAMAMPPEARREWGNEWQRRGPSGKRRGRNQGGD